MNINNVICSGLFVIFFQVWSASLKQYNFLLIIDNNWRQRRLLYFSFREEKFVFNSKNYLFLHDLCSHFLKRSINKFTMESYWFWHSFFSFKETFIHGWRTMIQINQGGDIDHSSAKWYRQRHVPCGNFSKQYEHVRLRSFRSGSLRLERGPFVSFFFFLS